MDGVTPEALRRCLLYYVECATDAVAYQVKQNKLDAMSSGGFYLTGIRLFREGKTP